MCEGHTQVLSLECRLPLCVCRASAAPVKHTHTPATQRRDITPCNGLGVCSKRPGHELGEGPVPDQGDVGRDRLRASRARKRLRDGRPKRCQTLANIWPKSARFDRIVSNLNSQSNLSATF